MKRTLAAVAAALAIALGAAYVVRMRGAGPELTGEWKSWRSAFRVAREGDVYRIVVTNPDGFLGGTYVGTLRGDALDVSGPLAPLCSRIDYLKDGDKLQFCGEEFERVRPPGAPPAATKAADKARP